MANICWITEKARESQKNIYFCFIDYTKAFDCIDHTLPASWEICMQVKKKQLEPDMEQWTGSKLGKEYNKLVIFNFLFNFPAYLTSM